MSTEITTFTVFLVAFTAVIGKELVELYHRVSEEKKFNDDDSFRIESRFKDPLSNAQIEEAKATASA